MKATRRNLRKLIYHLHARNNFLHDNIIKQIERKKLKIANKMYKKTRRRKVMFSKRSNKFPEDGYRSMHNVYTSCNNSELSTQKLFFPRTSKAMLPQQSKPLIEAGSRAWTSEWTEFHETKCILWNAKFRSSVYHYLHILQNNSLDEEKQRKASKMKLNSRYETM